MSGLKSPRPASSVRAGAARHESRPRHERHRVRLPAPGRRPGRIVDYLFARVFEVLYDGRILGEYREVLARPRLGIPHDDAAAVCSFIEAHGRPVQARPFPVPLPDPDDLPFVEVAVAGGADALVTGNAAHFPAELLPVRVRSPRAFLSVLEGE